MRVLAAAVLCFPACKDFFDAFFDGIHDNIMYNIDIRVISYDSGFEGSCLAADILTTKDKKRVIII